MWLPPPDPPSYLRPLCIILALALLGCAHRPSGGMPSALPRYQEFPVSTQALAAAAAQAVRSSRFGLELDVRATYPDIITTHSQSLDVKGLKALARRGDPGLWGVLLAARLTVRLVIRSSHVQAGYSRITIQPEFMAYISRLGDQRQWIRWVSNGDLEDELFAGIEAHLQLPGGE